MVLGLGLMLFPVSEQMHTCVSPDMQTNGFLQSSAPPALPMPVLPFEVPNQNVNFVPTVLHTPQLSSAGVLKSAERVKKSEGAEASIYQTLKLIVTASRWESEL